MVLCTHMADVITAVSFIATRRNLDLWPDIVFDVIGVNLNGMQSLSLIFLITIEAAVTTCSPTAIIYGSAYWSTSL